MDRGRVLVRQDTKTLVFPVTAQHFADWKRFLLRPRVDSYFLFKLNRTPIEYAVFRGLSNVHIDGNITSLINPKMFTWSRGQLLYRVMPLVFFAKQIGLVDKSVLMHLV